MNQMAFTSQNWMHITGAINHAKVMSQQVLKTLKPRTSEIILAGNYDANPKCFIYSISLGLK